jgi:hypothetical protein
VGLAVVCTAFGIAAAIGRKDSGGRGPVGVTIELEAHRYSSLTSIRVSEPERLKTAPSAHVPYE